MRRGATAGRERVQGAWSPRSGRHRGRNGSAALDGGSAGILPVAPACGRSDEGRGAGCGSRKVPPPGIPVADEVRRELETGAAALGREIESLRLAVKDRTSLGEVLPDVEGFHKAVD